jgi:hypothetical protein
VVLRRNVGHAAVGINIKHVLFIGIETCSVFEFPRAAAPTEAGPLPEADHHPLPMCQVGVSTSL